MPLRIRQAKEGETGRGAGRTIEQELQALKNEMAKLGKGMILEIETGSAQAVRTTKALVTRAGNQLGARWQHWHVGTKVFAKPVSRLKAMRGRGKQTAK